MDRKGSIFISLILAFLFLFSTINLNNSALAQTTSSVDVATYNVESPFPGESRRETLPRVVAEHIRELAGPNLWALSEVPDREAAMLYREAAQFPGSDFDFILGNTGSSRDLLAILYNRNRMQQVGEAQELINEVGGDRAPLVAQFQLIPDGTEFLAVANHFNRGSEMTRNQQARNLRRWIENQSLPVVALGDFNMDYSVDLSFERSSGCGGTIELGNEAYRIFTSSEQIKWIQPQCLSNSGTCPRTGTGCFDCFNSILDFVFVGGPNASGWTGTSEIAFGDDPDYCENDPLGGADHRPVLATLTYLLEPPSDTTPTPVSNLKIIELFPNPTGGNEVETLSETVTIANFGNQEVDLTGWQLRDRANTTWSLFGTLSSGQRIEFRRSDQPMALNNSGDTVELLNSAGEVVDTVTYLSTEEGEAIIFSSSRS